MESSINAIHFFKGKTILIIGTTGFLGKIMVEKVLRIQPKVSKLYLIIRAKDENSARQRLHDEILEKELFRILRVKYGRDLPGFVWEKVVAVPGDLTSENLGVKDSKMREEMWRNIDLVINFAATTRFDERYDVALETNTMAAWNVLSFAKRCVKLELLLHVSTAYVCGEASGLIKEKPIRMGDTLKETGDQLDISVERKLAEETLNQLKATNATDETVASTLKELGVKRARLFGWPNTYAFTKAMGEMMLGHYNKDNMPLVILRPTVITSTYKQPFPGWIENLRTMDSIIAAIGKGKAPCLPLKLDGTPDLIPADMVVNALMIVMMVNANKSTHQPMIYHIGTSKRNPVKTWQWHKFTYSYFIKNPCVDTNGMPIRITNGITFDSWDKYQRHVSIRYLLPLKALLLVNCILCNTWKHTCTEYERKINLAMRLGEFYKPFMFFDGIFDDTNIEHLRMAMNESGVDLDEFKLEPTCIDWEYYIMNTHIPGLLKYVVK